MIHHWPASWVQTDFSRYLIIISSLLLAACNNGSVPAPYLQLSGLTMGTTWSITINEPDRELQALTIKHSVDKLLDTLNASMSTYLPDSELSRINQSPGTDWIALSADLYQVIDLAWQVSLQSNGAFDITAGKLVNLWGFGPDGKTRHIPDSETINTALSVTGYQNIQLDPLTRSLRKLKPEIYLDLSGIGQGYAVDKLAELLEETYAIRNYLIDISGDIRTKGVNAEGKSWRIGIEKPLAGQQAIERVVTLSDAALSTSGDYRNYFEIDNIRYSHIIDPVSGRPITHDLVSVSVIHERCVIADAWDTALLVSGTEQGMQLANRYGLAVLFIVKTDTGFREILSDRMRAIIHGNNP